MPNLKTPKTRYSTKSCHRYSIVKEKTQTYLSSKTIQCSLDAADMMNSFYAIEKADYWREYFFIAYLNRANVCTGYSLISMGGLTGTVADPRIILLHAIESGCCGLMLAHNHPSGNLQPSRADEEITAKIKAALNMIDIKLYDHIIVTEDAGYYSFSDEGML